MACSPAQAALVENLHAQLRVWPQPEFEASVAGMLCLRGSSSTTWTKSNASAFITAFKAEVPASCRWASPSQLDVLRRKKLFEDAMQSVGNPDCDFSQQDASDLIERHSKKRKSF